MIFIITGTQKFPFDRLLKKIDELVAKKEIAEDVFAQIGYSTYTPQNYKYEKLMPMNIFENKIKDADTIIMHAGGGTIATCTKADKKIIIVPRLAKFGEHIDDHQLEIAKEYGERNLLEVCYDIEKLAEHIKMTKTKEFAKYENNNRKIVDIIEEFIGNV